MCVRQRVPVRDCQSEHLRPLRRVTETGDGGDLALLRLGIEVPCEALGLPSSGLHECPADSDPATLGAPGPYDLDLQYGHVGERAAPAVVGARGGGVVDGDPEIPGYARSALASTPAACASSPAGAGMLGSTTRSRMVTGPSGGPPSAERASWAVAGAATAAPRARSRSGKDGRRTETGAGGDARNLSAASLTRQPCAAFFTQTVEIIQIMVHLGEGRCYSAVAG